jgi:predicted DNA-binding transcriptional regulator AlpA
MSDTEQAKKPKRYSTAKQVRERYGGRSDMWIYRRLAEDPNFPRPFTIKKLRLFDDDELDAYDARMKARSTSNAGEAAG